MHFPPAPPSPSDLHQLVQAITHNPAEDTLTNSLTAAQWELLTGYLQLCVLVPGEVLITCGAADRAVYFVESGSLSVHFEDESQRIRLAIVGPGSIVGEGAFFSHRPRSATVQAVAECRLWSLASIRFTELSNRQPAVAVALAMAAGSVLAKRLGSRKRRVATT